MRKLFKAIRHRELAVVQEILGKKPDLITYTSKQPPKKDDGQSLLQVSIKTGNFEIAEYLLDIGADVNFIEKESCNTWNMPVIQDAIMAAVWCSRFMRLSAGKEWQLYNTKEKSDQAYNLLKRMFELGADIRGLDSHGNSCITRAVLDARQVLPVYSHVEKKITGNTPINDELREELTRIFALLYAQGADIRDLKDFAVSYKDESVGEFLIFET